jgi:uncharacterized membrane protein
MPQHLQYLAIAAIVGSGLVSGLLFAFSAVVMRALQELPPEAGMSTMQRVNVLIINPLFLLAFMGTSALCLAIAVVGVRGASSQGALWLLAGASAYLLGPLGVTMAFNVPLNNRLASVAPNQASAEWPRYVAAWLRWNHVRTLLGALATGLLSVGLAQAAHGA